MVARIEKSNSSYCGSHWGILKYYIPTELVEIMKWERHFCKETNN